MQNPTCRFLLVALFICSPPSALGLTLVERGEPRATIVLGADPADVDRAAARDIQDYLHRMSGARLPILETEEPPAGGAVLVGRSAAVERLVGDLLNEEHLGDCGYVLKTFPNRLVVVGHLAHVSDDPYHGMRYAAFALLEELGCRFFTPNADGEHIPRRATITVGDLNIVSKPDFAFRAPWNNGWVRPTLTEKTRKAWRSWFVKNKLGWGSSIQTGHAYEQWCSSHRYFDDHPEYFSYIRAKARRIPMTNQEGQLCLSNPEVVAVAAAAARRIFENTGERTFSLSPNDTEDWCECARCLALDDPDPAIGLATRVLHFNNQVAAEVSKTHPGRWFPYLGEYGNMTGPPVRADGTVVLKAHPAVMNVVVMGKRFCILHGIDDPICPKNAEYRRRLDVWQKVVKNLLIYEWLEPGSRLSTPQTWIVGPRIRYYRDLGVVRGYSGEILGRSPDNDLALYIVAKMLWDADQDPDALIQEYFDLYFQEAAEPMEAYYRALNRVGKGPDQHGYTLSFVAFTPEVFDELFPLLNQAAEAARQDVIKRRVQRDRNALEAYQLFMRAHDCCADWAKEDTSENHEAGRRALAEATAYLERIADQDIVAEKPLQGRLDGVKRRLEANAAKMAGQVASESPATTPATAAELRGQFVRFDLGRGVFLKLARIPAGSFMMGSPLAEHHREHDEGPQREVTIRKPFYMGVHEVTQHQYKIVMGSHPSRARSFAPGHPVANVYTGDAEGFCRALSEMIGLPVRLPTEAEWEYACRAGTTDPFHTGETITTDEANFNGTGVYGSGRKGQDRRMALPVGSFPPNAWGLHDMHGNVSEWCRDLYVDTYTDAPTRDPEVRKGGKFRVVRGGSWRDLPWHCRSAYRYRNHPGSELEVTGFRVVVPVEGE